MPPLRTTWVRASVRELVETKDPTWKTAAKVYTHLRYQRFLTLAPLSGATFAREDRTAYDATWRGVARRPPDLEAGWQIVLPAGVGGTEDGLTLVIVKVLPKGWQQVVLLREPDEVQPEVR